MSLRSRAGVLAVAGLATISVAACGSSSASGGAATSAASTAGGASTTAGSSGTAATGSPTAGASGSDSSSASAAASSQRYTAAQLDQAMAATTIDGRHPTVSAQSMVKETLSGAERFRSEVLKSLKISPAECQAAYSAAQVMGDGSTSTPASMGTLNDGKVVLVALQLPANSPDKWDASRMQKCRTITINGAVAGVSISGKATMSPVDVATSVATSPHGLAEVVTQNGKAMTTSIGLARVGDVELEVMHQGTAATGEQLGQELDGLAAQLKKLG